ncbi:hypothetical protein K443DRAFT_9850 [Laccaria amethystina LaAM-08-1]|uniref:Uncharacterized protein n=1 Tax=Laccaria amethystina LaAM-08-1 TaxID=1095629 RepID=A0A0C9WXQ4_9AGAR|nr:hypothetical protein K443DRAFT_9850 [Laccaria amethystina LaAM-08-1]
MAQEERTLFGLNSAALMAISTRHFRITLALYGINSNFMHTRGLAQVHERHHPARLRNTFLMPHPVAWHMSYNTRRKADASFLDSSLTWSCLGGFTGMNFRRDPNDLRRARNFPKLHFSRTFAK